MRQPKPGMRRNQPSSPHSFRCTDATWEKAKARASEDGVPMNYVVEQFLIGYAQGMLNLPQVKVSFSSAVKPE